MSTEEETIPMPEELVINVASLSVKNRGIKLPEHLGGAWVNYGGLDPEGISAKMGSLRVGDEIKLQVLNGKWLDYAVVGKSFAGTPPKSYAAPVQRKTMKDVLEDYTTFEELLKQLKEETEGRYGIETDIYQLDVERGLCVVNAKVVGTFKVGEKEWSRTATAHGDCDQKNGGMVKDHYVRMAETRAVARALRMILGVGKTAEEELAR